MRILVVLLTLITLLWVTPTASASSLAGGDTTSGDDTLEVYYAGPDSSVLTAISLSGEIVRVENIAAADVIILNGVVPDPHAVAEAVSTGAGVFLVLGPDIESRELEPILGAVTLEWLSDPLSLAPAGKSKESSSEQIETISDILWNSAPQVRERALLGFDAQTGFYPIVEGYEDGSLVLGKSTNGSGNIYLFTASLHDANAQLQDWSYFNYFVYHQVMRAAGREPVSFADYPASPVPHASERRQLLSLIAGVIAISFIAFWAVRRYSLAHPEALDSIVIDRAKYAAREAGTRWDEIGFHRPLGGFLLALMLGLLLFIPMIIYQNLIMPVYILPSAQALGIWGRVVQFFNLAWQFFDMGTSVAFIKYLSEYRVNDPKKGIQYGQLFIWWQALSGAVQVALIILLASTAVPRSTFAIYAWSIVIHAVIQIPGFYQVMRHVFTGLQRFDYAQILDMAGGFLFTIAFQPVIVWVMYNWGKSNPAFGGATGGLIGMGIAAYVMEAGSFLAGCLLFRRLGYNGRLLFMAHFDWGVIKNSFKFGVFEMFGSIAWAGGQAAEIWITQARLINYAEIWGNWGLAQNFIYSYQVILTLLNNLMPAISEAISHGRKKLSQYYAVQAYKYSGMVSIFIGAVLLAVADRFILGAAGTEFVRAAGYVVPLAIWGAVQYPSWIGDNVQLASNRPYLKSVLIGGEQIVRILIALVLLDQFQIYGLIAAYFIGLISKDIITYFVNDRFCFKQRFYFWQSLAAPLLAGAVHFFLLRGLTGIFWRADQISSIAIFFLGILLSFPVYMFLYGFFGGWDDETLEELRQAVPLTHFVEPVARLFWASTAAGARVSPLHNRFPIDIRSAALEEARTLTLERRDLLASASTGEQPQTDLAVAESLL